jgi:RNA-directed DNA polymerase
LELHPEKTKVVYCQDDARRRTYPNEKFDFLGYTFRPRGWLQYYGRYYRSALYPPMRQLDRSLARWAERKYKKLRGHLRRATHWVARISRRDPKLFAHWQMGVRRGSMAGAV